MRLYLVRHGEAGHAAHDDERALTPRGAEETRNVFVAAASLLAAECPCLWSSPLRRARQTAGIAATVLSCRDAAHRISEALRPETPLEQLATELETNSQWPLMLVAHQPLLGKLLSWLVDDDSLRHGVPTSGLYALDVIAFVRGGASLLWHRYP